MYFQIPVMAKLPLLQSSVSHDPSEISIYYLFSNIYTLNSVIQKG